MIEYEIKKKKKDGQKIQNGLKERGEEGGGGGGRQGMEERIVQLWLGRM